MTFTIIAVCIVVHWMQAGNRDEVEKGLRYYCSVAPDLSDQFNLPDPVRSNPRSCYLLMLAQHADSYRPRLPALIEKFHSADAPELSRFAYVKFVRGHYLRFENIYPPLLDDRLVTSTEFINPVRVVTATFAHGDWMHLIGNMIFFFAFAPILELIIASAWRYLLVIFSIAFSSATIYFVIGVLTGGVSPALGFSGVVMGMIGLGAYLTPKVKIRTFVWLLTLMRNVYIPAWILAVWYVGWDLYSLIDTGKDVGVAYSAHLGGALSGYLIGWFFYKDRKAEIQNELDDEIDYQRSLREDKMGMLSTYKGGQARIEANELAHQQKKDRAAWLQRMHIAADSRRIGGATIDFVQNIEKHLIDADQLDQIMEEIGQWRPSRFQDNVYRYYIDRCFCKGRLAAALTSCKSAFSANPNFLIGDPSQLLSLITAAEESGHYELALNLADQVFKRYPNLAEALAIALTEVRLLAGPLMRETEAAERVRSLLKRYGTGAVPQLDALARALEIVI